jgi:multidrug efflux pump subunit AcrB
MGSYSVKRPITVLMGVLIIIVLGVFSVTRLPLTLFPDINLPFVVTVTSYEGATPEELETEVSRRIESSVQTIGNFEEVQSISNENFAISIVTFAQSTNMDTVVIELRENLNNIEFLEGVGTTSILRISPDMLPVMTVTMFRTYEEELSDDDILIRNTEWINREILPELESIPGVASVGITGAADVVLEVDLDSAKLASYDLSRAEVLEIIDAQNQSGLVGVVLDSGEIRFLYLGDSPTLLEDLERLPITRDGQTIVRLSDLAKENGIHYVNANTETYSKINGEQGIQISFQKSSDVGITDATTAIHDRLDQIVADSDGEAAYEVLLDQGEYINVAISSVLQNIVIGGMLAIIILFMFLRDIKPTIIVGLAIPISVIAAFMLMYLTNVSLNLVSMGGLALGIGMLVDNSVVVIENIFRMINEGRSKVEAAIEGSKQVAGAITASTLTTIAVFLPIIFIEGLIAEVFIGMALTITFSLGASLIIALTLVPSMASRFLKDSEYKKDSSFLSRMKNAYESSVRFTIKHKLLMFAMVLLLLVASLGLALSKGFILLPTSDEGIINVGIDVENGLDFEDRATYADYVMESVLELEDVEAVSASIGGGMAFGPMAMMGSSGDISLTVTLKNDRNRTTRANTLLIEERLLELDFAEIEGVTAEDISEIDVSSQNSTAAITGAQGVEIKVAGSDLLVLEEIANDLTTILGDIEGLEDVDNGISQGEENVKITVNKDNAMKKGLTNRDVQKSLSYLFSNLEALGQAQTIDLQIEGVTYTLSIPEEAFGGTIDLTILGDYEQFLGGVRLFNPVLQDLIDAYIAETNESIYVVNAMLPDYQIGTPIQLVVNPDLKVSSDNRIINDPASVRPTLGSLASAKLFDDDNETSITRVERVTGFASISTDGSNRFLSVTAAVMDGYNVTLVGQDVNDKVSAYLDSEDFTQFGGGYAVTFQGENEEIMAAVEDLVLAAIVAVLLVYMIMAIQFQSLAYPLIILGTIPLAFTGGLIAILVTNAYLSLVSLMGMIILIGIVVNNGIVLIDYINKLREKGYTIEKAIVEAGKTRLRPIFMTALTTILALLTLAFGFGEGSELLQPMAITAIGGLIYATILTLVVVPTVYALMNNKKMKVEAAEHADD